MPKKLLIAVSLLCVLMGCEEEIPYDGGVVEKSDKLIVLGWITDEAKPQTVKLVKIRPVNEADSENEVVSGADLSLSNELGTWPLNEVKPGVYRTDSTWQASPNDSIKLKINWRGEHYNAAAFMSEVKDFEPFRAYSAEELGIDIGPPGDGWPILQFLTNQFGFDDAARWEMRLRIDPRHAPPGAPDTLIESDPEVFFTHPSLETNGLLSLESIDHKIVPDSTVLILSKFSLSDEAYDYYRAVLTETDWSGRIYSTIPGNVPSNITNGAIGFLGASAVLTKTRILYIE